MDGWDIDLESIFDGLWGAFIGMGRFFDGYQAVSETAEFTRNLLERKRLRSEIGMFADPATRVLSGKRKRTHVNDI